MQMFGVGVLELMVIMVLAVIVIGPDRLPQFAADLAKWIRQARAYGQHLTRDWNQVVGDLEKEVGASREDWKEIGSVLQHHTGGLTKEIEKVTASIDSAAGAATLEPASAPAATNGNASPEAVPLGDRPAEEVVTEEIAASTEPETNGATAAAQPEQPWYVPEKPIRRRRSE